MIFCMSVLSVTCKCIFNDLLENFRPVWGLFALALYFYVWVWLPATGSSV